MEAGVEVICFVQDKNGDVQFCKASNGSYLGRIYKVKTDAEYYIIDRSAGCFVYKCQKLNLEFIDPASQTQETDQ